MGGGSEGQKMRFLTVNLAAIDTAASAEAVIDPLKADAEPNHGSQKEFAEVFKMGGVMTTSAG